MAFHWETDEGGAIDEPSLAPESAPRRRWPFLLLVVLIVSLAALVTWRRLQSRAAAALVALEEDVRSSQRLLSRAAAQQDEELLMPLLSGSDAEWTAAQRELFAKRLFLERAPRALGLEPVEGAPVVAGITFSPELLEATVTIRHSYAVTTTDGVQEMVLLQQELIFRRGEQRWLLSPTRAGYWGEWRFAGGSDVRLSYPERDESFALELLPYLRQKVAEFCAAGVPDCQPPLGLSLRLESNPQVLADSAGAQWLTRGSNELVLPTPSLIGVPLDARGREALLRAYAARAIAALNVYLLGYDCCTQALFFESLQWARLEALGLQSAPLAARSFLSIVEQPLSRQRLSELWWDPDRQPPTEQERLQIMAFIRFLLHSPGTTAAALQQGIVQGYGFRTWVYRLTPHDPGLGQNEFEDAWRAFVLAQANATQRGLEQPAWPEQRLILVCRSFLAQHGIYRVDLASGELEQLARLATRGPGVVVLPGDDGIMVFDVPGTDTDIPVELWQSGRASELDPDYVPTTLYSPDPQGRYLSVRRDDDDDGIGDQAILLDTWECDQNGDCPLQPLPGLPAWSPDGDRFLLIDEKQGLMLGKRQSWELEPVDSEAIRMPFWIDERRYGYLAGEGRTVRLREVGTSEENSLHMVDMQPVLRASEEGRNWEFAEIIPVAGDQLLVTLTLPRSQLRHFFLVSNPGEPQQTTEPILYAPLYSLSGPDSMVSPDGRWLFVHLVAGEITESRFLLYDLVERKVVLDFNAPYFVGTHFNDWSSDGRWMARLGRRFVEVLAPAEDGSGELFRHFISTDNQQCSAAAWINPWPDS